MNEEARTWLDTVAGRFHASAGDPGFPTPQEFRWAEQEEIRLEARRAYDEAHRPGQPPSGPYTAEERMKAYRNMREQIYARANWVTGDDMISERLRRMRAERLADEGMPPEASGPAEMSSAQIEAYNRMAEATRGVPRV